MRRVPRRAAQPGVVRAVEPEQSRLAAQCAQGWQQRARAGRVGELLSARERRGGPGAGALRQGRARGQRRAGATDALDRDGPVRLRAPVGRPARARAGIRSDSRSWSSCRSRKCCRRLRPPARTAEPWTGVPCSGHCICARAPRCCGLAARERPGGRGLPDPRMRVVPTAPTRSIGSGATSATRSISSSRPARPSSAWARAICRAWRSSRQDNHLFLKPRAAERRHQPDDPHQPPHATTSTTPRASGARIRSGADVMYALRFVYPETVRAHAPRT